MIPRRATGGKNRAVEIRNLTGPFVKCEMKGIFEVSFSSDYKISGDNDTFLGNLILEFALTWGIILYKNQQNMLRKQKKGYICHV